MLEIRTAFAASIFVDAVLVAAALGAFISYRKLVACTLCWLIAFSTTFAAQCLFLFRGMAPEFLSIGIADLLIAVGFAATILGAARMSGRRPHYVLIAPVYLAFLVSLSFYGIYRKNLEARALVISALIVFGSILSAAYFAAPVDKEKRPALRPSMLSFSALAVVFTCRIVVIAFFELKEDWTHAPDWETWLYLASTAVSVGVGFAYMRSIDGLLAMDLKKSAEENALLLREIRHRSKNDLALIASLVSLQAETVREPEARAAFDGLQDRIRTISAVYRLLSSVQGERKADAGEYLRAIAAGLRDGLTGGRNIAFKVRAESLHLDSSHLIPLGLIVNELATNAVKYAFPDRRAGTIYIELSSTKGRGNLSVYDDGVGGMLEKQEKQGLGLTLTQAFAAQLHGNLQPKSIPGEGTRFVLDFPLT